MELQDFNKFSCWITVTLVHN